MNNPITLTGRVMEQHTDLLWLPYIWAVMSPSWPQFLVTTILHGKLTTSSSKQEDSISLPAALLLQSCSFIR